MDCIKGPISKRLLLTLTFPCGQSTTKPASETAPKPSSGSSKAAPEKATSTADKAEDDGVIVTNSPLHPHLPTRWAVFRGLVYRVQVPIVPMAVYSHL